MDYLALINRFYIPHIKHSISLGLLHPSLTHTQNISLSSGKSTFYQIPHGVDPHHSINGNFLHRIHSIQPYGEPFKGNFQSLRIAQIIWVVSLAQPVPHV